ncbi:MAG TPA: hypothetical protein VGH40_04215, partial [Roseiarcus sp.]
YVAAVIRARLAEQPSPAAFRYRDSGSLATIGKRAAIIDFGWIKLRGRIAWWAWGVAHIYFLIGLRHRLSVALNWLWIYTSGQRGARLITQGRPANGYKFGAPLISPRGRGEGGGGEQSADAPDRGPLS